MSSTEARSVEEIVRERYSAGARKREEALCCPVEYDPKYLKIIPKEILERDYGCGDPSEHVRAGETVLDLGSGGGKICYIAAQKVGADGHVEVAAIPADIGEAQGLLWAFDSLYAAFRAGALARTLKPMTGAWLASARPMSDSVMAPTPECRTRTRTSSLPIFSIA